MRRIRRHLTFANVASGIALFVALSGGTAVALNGANTVFSDDIVNGEVKSLDVRDGGLTPTDVHSVVAPAVGGPTTIPPDNDFHPVPLTNNVWKQAPREVDDIEGWFKVQQMSCTGGGGVYLRVDAYDRDGDVVIEHLIDGFWSSPLQSRPIDLAPIQEESLPFFSYSSQGIPRTVSLRAFAQNSCPTAATVNIVRAFVIAFR